MDRLLLRTVEKTLPQANVVVVDHFHLIDDANHRLDEARKNEQEGSKVEIPRKLFLMGKERLKPAQKRKVEAWCQKYPSLKEFYWMKEALRSFYKLKDKKTAVFASSHWLPSSLYRTFCNRAFRKWTSRLHFGIFSSMNSARNNWLVIGVQKNWEKALSQPVPLWGLKPRYKIEFSALDIGDILWFYATAPISGIIGIGTVKDKYIDSMSLVWEDEIIKREGIWPLRFRIQVLKAINRKRWQTDCIKIVDFKLNWQIGFQLLQETHLRELSTRAAKIFGENVFAGATIAAPMIRDKKDDFLTITKQPQSHRDLQEAIAEIGKLQFYHTELEFPLALPGEDKNLDVVWKREISGVPTFAFEVELSGSIEKAIARLKFAFKLWNSRPRMAIPKEFASKVHNLLSAEERDFHNQFKLYEPAQLIELLDRKRDLKSLEQKLEIY